MALISMQDLRFAFRNLQPQAQRIHARHDDQRRSGLHILTQVGETLMNDAVEWRGRGEHNAGRDPDEH